MELLLFNSSFINSLLRVGAFFVCLCRQQLMSTQPRAKPLMLLCAPMLILIHLRRQTRISVPLLPSHPDLDLSKYGHNLKTLDLSP